MEMEVGKLFVGGISWETNEERLVEYFQAFGEVLEAVIMRDRATGRARGFGFVVFADASVAERVVRERHVIDGRTVEAKKAVPREDHQTPNRNMPGPQSPARTKKIFVGGLPSTITESDFKKYFGQFGTITDVVVMYDHNTQRPRGFGFITYDSEEPVDRVLVKTFHELNGKMVEVKRAVPKELSPGGPARSPSSYSPNRAGGLFNCYSPGYSGLNSSGGYGMRMDGRFNTIGRVGYPPYSPGNHSVGSNLETGWGLLNSGLGYRNGMEYSYFGGNSGKNGSFLNDREAYIANSGSSNGLLAAGGGLRNIGENWAGIGSSPVSANAREGIIYGGVQDNYGGMAGYARDNRGVSDSESFFSGTDIVRDEGFNSFYSDNAWHSLLEGPADVAPNNPVGYVGDYRVTSSNRGIAA
ncbi:RNA-binding (RRM/RBD/RNP motifs) family protein [Striga hermonthica]|uniref:RNA-binding (RRM/RBD/RNP motifs) family protein n=1 Tax=Striga hermonthica TaxID=68872 RepID=A0A9N7NVW6_STRHE|nr:RNA-binding (RRM/RBD/RNP motifs) family protein [Striga hermonthica]